MENKQLTEEDFIALAYKIAGYGDILYNDTSRNMSENEFVKFAKEAYKLATPIKFIVPVEYFCNCPVHDGGFYSHIEIFNTLEDLKKYLIENLNECHAEEVVMLNSNDKYEIYYESESHRFNGIKIHINDELKYRTIDNGSGKLIWKEIDYGKY